MSLSARAVELDDKDIDEHDDIFFVVGPALRSGESFALGDVVMSIEARHGADPNPDAVWEGAATLQGTDVVRRLQGGVAGVTYLIRCKVTTSLGRVLVGAMLIRARRLV